MLQVLIRDLHAGTKTPWRWPPRGEVALSCPDVKFGGQTWPHEGRTCRTVYCFEKEFWWTRWTSLSSLYIYRYKDVSAYNTYHRDTTTSSKQNLDSLVIFEKVTLGTKGLPTAKKQIPVSAPQSLSNPYSLQIILGRGGGGSGKYYSRSQYYNHIGIKRQISV